MKYYSPCALLISKKVKVVFLYSAISSPLDRSKRFTLFALRDRPVHSNSNSASPGSILARQQLPAKAKSLTCPPLSIARYSFIQLSQKERQRRERKCPIFETVAKRDSNLGSLDCESGILPLSYSAPLVQAYVKYTNEPITECITQRHALSRTDVDMVNSP